MLKKDCVSDRWRHKVPHKSNYQPTNPCCNPCNKRRAYISWCDQPSICCKRANITYLNQAPERAKFPAYITWAQTPRKCSKLVHIVWKSPPKSVEKSVDVTWVDCPETKKRVEICWLNECPKPVVKTKDIHVTLLTRRCGDGRGKRSVLLKPPPDCTPTVLPRTKTIHVYCTR